MTVLPRVTWPSPPRATAPLRRTARIVVPWKFSASDMSALASGSGVGSVVYPGQVLEIKVRVDLGCTDVGVPQKFLHAPQVATRFQQVAGEGMSEQVRVHAHAEPPAPRPALDATLHGAWAEPPPVASHEDRSLVGRCDRCSRLEPRLQRRACLRANGHYALLVALAAHTHRVVGEVD